MAAKRRKLAKYRTFAGTPNHMEEGEHETEAPAKGWMMTRLRARKKWANSFNHKVEAELQTIIEQVSGLNLRDAKKGREWEWRAVDVPTGVQFVFRIEVVY